MKPSKCGYGKDQLGLVDM